MVLEEEKDQLHVRLPVSLLEKFRRMAYQKHPLQAHGALSFEVEQALSTYLSLHHTQTQNTQNETFINPQNPTPKVFRLYKQIKQYLGDKHRIDLERIANVPLALLIEAIKVIKGTDDRTVKKWMEELKRNHCIKEITPNLFEVT